jgi:hypothetical protein
MKFHLSLLLFLDANEFQVFLSEIASFGSISFLNVLKVDDITTMRHNFSI